MCKFSSTIRKDLTLKLLGKHYTMHHDNLIKLLYDHNLCRIKLFFISYIFPAMLYHLRREHNNRKYGQQLMTHVRLIKLIDRTVLNRLSSIAMLDQTYGEGLTEWFATWIMILFTTMLFFDKIICYSKYI